MYSLFFKENSATQLLLLIMRRCVSRYSTTLWSYFLSLYSRSVEEFCCLNRIEEGTFGVVYRARDKKRDEIVALKRLKMENEKEGFPITSLREINTLLKAQHVNIVTCRVSWNFDYSSWVDELHRCWHFWKYFNHVSFQSHLFQEIVVGSNMDKIYIVMDYVEHDLKSLMEGMKQPFLVGKYHFTYALFSACILSFLSVV